MEFDKTLTVRWKKHDSSEYYSYNPETGILYILLNEPLNKGYIVKRDKTGGNMLRNYHKELYHGVPTEYRLYAECTKQEYSDIWHDVVTFTNDSFRTTLNAIF